MKKKASLIGPTLAQSTRFCSFTFFTFWLARSTLFLRNILPYSQSTYSVFRQRYLRQVLVNLLVVGSILGMAACNHLDSTDQQNRPPNNNSHSKSELGEPPQQMHSDMFSWVQTDYMRFAQENRDPQSYYVRLRSTPLLNAQDQCARRSGFFAFLQRTIGINEAGAITLVARVTLSGEELSLPYSLFEFAMNEADCNTDMVDRSITPYYIVTPNQSFDLDISILTSQAVNVSVVERLKAISDALSLLNDGIGTLLTFFESDTLNAQDVDNALSQDWTQRTSYRTSINTRPPDGTDWDAHNDAIIISAPIDSAQDELTALIRIYPEYRKSFFADEGLYMNSAGIRVHRVGAENGHTLTTLLSARAYGGVRLDHFWKIADPNILSRFCVELRTDLAKHFSRDDQLAALYAVLEGYTPFMWSEPLRQSHCLVERDKERLLQMSDEFKVPDITRETNEDRTPIVQDRMLPITTALRHQDRVSFESLLEDIDNFSLRVVDQQTFPNQYGWKDELSGRPAVDQLMSISIRSGCYNAFGSQNLNSIAMVVLPDINNATPTGALAKFNLNGHLQEFIFLDIAIVRVFEEEFLRENCSLL